MRHLCFVVFLICVCLSGGLRLQAEAYPGWSGTMEGEKAQSRPSPVNTFCVSVTDEPWIRLHVDADGGKTRHHIHTTNQPTELFSVAGKHEAAHADAQDTRHAPAHVREQAAVDQRGRFHSPASQPAI